MKTPYVLLLGATIISVAYLAAPRLASHQTAPPSYNSTLEEYEWKCHSDLECYEECILKGEEDCE